MKTNLKNPLEALLSHIAVEVEKIIEVKMSEYIERNSNQGKGADYIPISKLAESLDVTKATLLNWSKNPKSELKAYTLNQGGSRTSSTYFKRHEVEKALKQRYKTNLNFDI